MASSSAACRTLGRCRILMNATITATAKTAKATTDAAAKTKPVSGIQKPKPISTALQAFIGDGAKEVSRTEAVKKIWSHIKANNLQDPNKKREIICDQKLKTIFGGKGRINMLEISGLLSQHFVKSG